MAWCIMNCVGTNFALNPVPTEVDLVFSIKNHTSIKVCYSVSAIEDTTPIPLSRIF
jgi:hypothetical protein